MAYRVSHLPMPLERTAIYLVPMFVGTAGVVAAASGSNAIRRGLMVTLFVMASYFLLCLRLTYFREWKWCGDAQSAYTALTYYGRAYGIRDVASSWHYVASLNFYREQHQDRLFSEFVAEKKYPAGKQAYVLNEPFDRDVIAREGLKVVYRGEMSDMVIAVTKSANLPAAP